METDASDQAALDEAARWYARLQAPDCTEQERQVFAEWRTNDAHREAFRKAERLSALIAHAAAADPRLRAIANRALADRALDDARDDAHRRARADVRKRRWSVPASLAAGIVAAALVLGLNVTRHEHETLHYASTAARQELSLPDGTHVTLDVRTEIEVDFGAGSRRVNLQRGRALFDVAHDAERPFVVTVGDSSVKALGTVFQVYRRGSRDVVVTLAEGAVEVSGDVQGRTQRQRLAPGEELHVSKEKGSWSTRRVDAAAATSWIDGRHVFRDVRLADAVDEVNRYASRRVVIADPSLAELTVSGSFVAGDTASIVAAFAAVLPIRVSESGEELLLFRRR